MQNSDSQFLKITFHLWLFKNNGIVSMLYSISSQLILYLVVCTFSSSTVILPHLSQVISCVQHQFLFMSCIKKLFSVNGCGIRSQFCHCMLCAPVCVEPGMGSQRLVHHRARFTGLVVFSLFLCDVLYLHFHFKHVFRHLDFLFLLQKRLVCLRLVKTILFLVLMFNFLLSFILVFNGVL